MRHVYMRSFLAMLWLIAAIISGVSGNLLMCEVYVVLCGLFGWSAYGTWQKEKGDK